MTDQPTTTQPEFKDDTLIPIPTADGKVRMEPLSKVRTALAETSRLRVENASYASRKQDLDFVDGIRDDFAREGPETALKRIKRGLGMPDGPALESDPDVNPDIAELKRSVAHLAAALKDTQSKSEGTRTTAETQEALDEYGIFDRKSSNPVHKIARLRAEKAVYAEKMAGDKRPIAEIVADVHADFYAMAKGHATEKVLKAEAAAAADAPALPAGAGVSTVTTRPKFTMADLKPGGKFTQHYSDVVKQGGPGAIGLSKRVDNRRT